MRLKGIKELRGRRVEALLGLSMKEGRLRARDTRVGPIDFTRRGISELRGLGRFERRLPPCRRSPS